MPLPALTRRVGVRFMVGIERTLVNAIMAPAEPEVGLLEPYPLALDVRDSSGAVVPIGFNDRRQLVEVLQNAYYELEESDG